MCQALHTTCSPPPLMAAERQTGAFQAAQWVRNPPAVQEMEVQSLGQKDPLEGGMATHSSILAWRITWTEEPSGLQPTGSQKVRHD